MTCDEFESLLATETTDGRVVGAAHRASCGRCDALYSAFLEIDGALTLHYGRVCAPQMPLAIPAPQQISVLPETLDFFGWAGVFASVGIAAWCFAPSAVVISQQTLVASMALLLCVAGCVTCCVTLWAFRANEI